MLLTILLLAFATGLLLLARRTGRSTSGRSRPSTTLFIIGTAVITSAFAFQSAASSLNVMLAFNLFMYIGFAILMLSMGMIAANHMGLGHVEDPHSILILSVVPVIVLIILASDPWTGLFYSQIEVRSFMGGTYLQTVRVWGYFLMWGYITILGLLMTAPIVRSLRGVSDADLDYIVVVLLGMVLTVALSSLPNDVIDVPTALVVSLTLSVMAVILFLVTVRSSPYTWSLSFQEVLDQSSSAEFILDNSGRILYQNKTAKSLIDGAGSDMMETLTKVFRKEVPSIQGQELCSSSDEDGRTLDVRSVPLNTRTGEPCGQIMTLKDMTESVRLRSSLVDVNERIRLISGITRHFMINDITALNGMVYLLEDASESAGKGNLLITMQKAIDTIHRQLVFMEDYEQLGEFEPKWAFLPAVITDAMFNIDIGTVEKSMDLEDVDILADPLLEKVFTNLMHNSMVHGGDVRRMEFFTERKEADLAIHYRDDGYGIAPEFRDGLFERGIGRNSGLGLFLSRNILAMTGLSIHEEGVEGKGADFVITVPDGSWRPSPTK